MAIKVALGAVVLFLVGAVTQARAQGTDTAAAFAALNWQEGPTTGALGEIATIFVPEGYSFLGRGDTSKFMELLENPSDRSELGLLLHRKSSWYVVFEFSSDGYVKDDDRDLDADAILQNIREGTAQANEIRRQRGWAPIEVVGWQQKPFYDSRSNNLTWAITGRADGELTINHSTRLLGRRGVMKANLVLSPEDVGTAVPAFDSLLTDFDFNPGQRYAEFRPGDKVAEYGLAGLIAGGAGVALVKTGLLQKFWKLIVVAFIALASLFKRVIAAFGRKRDTVNQGANV